MKTDCYRDYTYIIIYSIHNSCEKEEIEMMYKTKMLAGNRCKIYYYTLIYILLYFNIYIMKMIILDDCVI